MAEAFGQEGHVEDEAPECDVGDPFAAVDGAAEYDSADPSEMTCGMVGEAAEARAIRGPLQLLHQGPPGQAAPRDH
eukprot:2150246-Alexandrium_andersonii.AAC.1